MSFGTGTKLDETSGWPSRSMMAIPCSCGSVLTIFASRACSGTSLRRISSSDIARVTSSISAEGELDGLQHLERMFVQNVERAVDALVGYAGRNCGRLTQAAKANSTAGSTTDATIISLSSRIAAWRAVNIGSPKPRLAWPRGPATRCIFSQVTNRATSCAERAAEFGRDFGERTAHRADGIRRAANSWLAQRFLLPVRGEPEFAARLTIVIVYVTAVGASASMSVATSITAGRLAASARASAGAMSAGFSTRMPSAPMSSASRAKFIGR